MVRLMEIQELNTVLDMWTEINKEVHTFVDAQYWDEQRETMIEVLGNANVYVYDEHDVIKGFAFIVEGYYLGGVFVEAPARRRKFATGLITFIKSRYDELVVTIYEDNTLAQDFILTQGFAREESDVDEATGVNEITYGWFSPNE